MCRLYLLPLFLQPVVTLILLRFSKKKKFTFYINLARTFLSSITLLPIPLPKSGNSQCGHVDVGHACRFDPLFDEMPIPILKD